MQYKNKRVAITGVGNGFIADKLLENLKQLGATITVLDGDIRNPETFKLDYKHDYLFHFAAPSSQVLFKRKPLYCADVTINGFINAQRACSQHGVKLIYPSTGILSQGATNEYARCKQLCEDIALSVGNLDSLGLRIFATYGPTEGHKRDYASVPYLFIRDMVNGKAPLIFGDGNQVRDLIYIDDVINAIIILAEEANEKIIDIGSGVQTSFNDIIKVTNGILQTTIKPTYREAPQNYVTETMANTTVLDKYYKPTVSIHEGILNVVKELKDEKA